MSGFRHFKEHLCLQQSALYCDDTPAVQQAVRHTIVTLHNHPVGCISQYCDGIITAQPAVYHTIVTLHQHPVSFISHYCDGIPTIQLDAYHTIDDTTSVQLAGNHIKMVYPLTSQLYITTLSLSLGKRQTK